MHSRSQLSNSEKLAYLKHALKEGTAKRTIDGLSGSGDHYEEAIDCLKKRFDRPRLIHQAHVRSILEVPTLRIEMERNCVVCMTQSVSTFAL